MRRGLSSLKGPCLLSVVRVSQALAQQPSICVGLSDFISRTMWQGLQVTTAGNEGEKGAAELIRFLNYFSTLTSLG